MQNRSPRSLAFLGLVLIAGAGASSALAQQAGLQRQAKIGYVDADRILRESIPAKLARAKIEADFAPRQREIEASIAKNQQASEAFDHDAPSLSESERARRQMEVLLQDRKIQRLQRAYSDDLSQRKSQELAILQENANKAIRKIAQNENFDLIVQEATYVNPRIDITEKVIAELATTVK
jgi:outer membrane protein